MFFTGTAAEVTPVRSVDRIDVGDGKTGPITLALQKQFWRPWRRNDDPHGYLHLRERVTEAQERYSREGILAFAAQFPFFH